MVYCNFVLLPPLPSSGACISSSVLGFRFRYSPALTYRAFPTEFPTDSFISLRWIYLVSGADQIGPTIPLNMSFIPPRIFHIPLSTVFFSFALHFCIHTTYLLLTRFFPPLTARKIHVYVVPTIPYPFHVRYSSFLHVILWGVFLFFSLPSCASPKNISVTAPVLSPSLSSACASGTY